MLCCCCCCRGCVCLAIAIRRPIRAIRMRMTRKVNTIAAMLAAVTRPDVNGVIPANRPPKMVPHRRCCSSSLLIVAEDGEVGRTRGAAPQARSARARGGASVRIRCGCVLRPAAYGRLYGALYRLARAVCNLLANNDMNCISRVANVRHASQHLSHDATPTSASNKTCPGEHRLSRVASL